MTESSGCSLITVTRQNKGGKFERNENKVTVDAKDYPLRTLIRFLNQPSGHSPSIHSYFTYFRQLLSSNKCIWQQKIERNEMIIQNACLVGGTSRGLRLAAFPNEQIRVN
ncbi:hypothetical protein X798_01803 [Onchocerca flexuosa]|uniref:Uncharacterized protein n=2 Tax=Onchocerca flexuosa TaxID=387005 RepID=A0A183HDT9_9BILA|nr:hypothetical protein X798_01803 [Onchocerca flexuosa]VDO43851.1 unnamed protein product [Onchocerca flexuosa]